MTTRREILSGLLAATATAGLAADKKDKVGTDQTGSADNIVFRKKGLDHLRQRPQGGRRRGRAQVRRGGRLPGLRARLHDGPLDDRQRLEDIIPDFWMKTIHPTDYWSFRKDPRDDGEGEPGAEKRGRHDNCWCRDPEALAVWFERREKPWIAFKTMAAGAVSPEKALPFAFEHGADFVCMGMMDFQVVDDVNIATAAFDRGFPNRRRKWH